MKNNSLILGFGDHGLNVIKDLLSNSSRRGLLQLQHDSIDSAENIEGARFFHCSLDESMHDLQSDTDMFPDLYAAVRTFSRSDIRNRFEEVVARIVDGAKALLQVRTSDRAEAVLDVFVVCHFDHEQQFDEIDTFLVALFDQLGNLPAFRNNIATPSLNLVGFYDFKGLMMSNNAGAILRSALEESQKNWLRRQKKGRSRSFSRIYITDEFNEKGSVRNAKARRMQTVTFLQLLLFEAMDGQERLALMRSGSGEQTDFLASFGIEAVETGIELLCQLAAANFMSNRLMYLTGDRLKIDGHGREFNELKSIATLQNVDLNLLLSDADFTQKKTALEQELFEIEQGLMAEFTTSYSETRLEEIEQAIIKAKLGLVDKMFDDARQLENGLVKDTTLSIERAIDDDLDRATPVSVILEHLEDCRQRLRVDDTSYQEEITHIQSQLAQRLEEYKKRSRQFENYKKVQLNLAQNNWVWLCYSLFVAILLTPSLTYSALQLEALYPTNQAWTWLGNYPWVLLLGSVLLVSVPTYFFGRNMAGNYLRRSLDWYLHKQQGRLYDALSSLVSMGAHFDAISLHYKRALIKGLSRNVSRIRNSLMKRSEEADWLRKSLSGYYEDSQPSKHEANESCVYSMLSDTEFLEQVQDVMPADPVSITKQASDEGVPRVFSEWRRRFQKLLLSPMNIIESTSGFYKAGFLNERRERLNPILKARATDCLNRISKKFSTNLSSGGETQTYAFIGEEFAAVAEPSHELGTIFGVNTSSTIGGVNKLYLLKLKTFVDLQV